MAVVFTGRFCWWREDGPGGLAVLDMPADLVADLGGRRQTRGTGTLAPPRSPAAPRWSPAAASASA